MRFITVFVHVCITDFDRIHLPPLLPCPTPIEPLPFPISLPHIFVCSWDPRSLITALLRVGMRDYLQEQGQVPCDCTTEENVLHLFVFSMRSLASGRLWSESPDQSPVCSQCSYNPRHNGAMCEDHGGRLGVLRLRVELSQHKECVFSKACSEQR